MTGRATRRTAGRMPGDAAVWWAGAYGARAVLWRGAWAGLPLVATHTAFDIPRGDTLSTWLTALLAAGMALVVTLALPLAVAGADVEGAGEVRWTATIVMLPAVVVALSALWRLGLPPAWSTVAIRVGYAVLVAVVASSAIAGHWADSADGTNSAPHGARSIVGAARAPGALLPCVMRGALALWLAAAVWAVIDRSGWAPLGFAPLIVRLTAIHFHVAGVVVPVIAAAVARAYPSRLADAAAVLAVAGVPATAAGITAVQLGAPPAVEAVLALPMIAGALLVAAVHLAVASGSAGATAPAVVRALRAIVGVTLLATIGLAAAYAARAAGLWAPTIPAMVRWHGVGNIVGVGLCGLVACWLDPATRPALERAPSDALSRAAPTGSADRPPAA